MKWIWIGLGIVVVIIIVILVVRYNNKNNMPSDFKRQVDECKEMRKTMKFAKAPPPCEIEIANKLSIELKKVPKTESTKCPTGWHKAELFGKVYCTPTLK